jgi:hypothetical protein
VLTEDSTTIGDDQSRAFSERKAHRTDADERHAARGIPRDCIAARRAAITIVYRLYDER